MGERATGMAGAFTGLANDESGAYYNPAGPAMAAKDSLSLTTNFYGIALGSIDGPLGPGTDVSYATLNLIPATSSSLMHLGGATDGVPSPWVFCFNVFAPGSSSQQQRTLFESKVAYRSSINQRQILAGPTLARRLGERWAVGVSLFGSLKTNDNEYSLTGATLDAAGKATSIVDIAYAESSLNFGLAASAGVRFQATEHWSLGFSARTPVFHVMDKSTVYAHVLSFSNGDANPTFQMRQADTRTRFEVPTKLSVGAAWSKPKSFTVSVDFTAHLPQTTVVDATQGTVSDLQFTPNAAIGFEGYLGERVAIRGGLFTDLSNVAVPNPAANVAPDKVDTFGATLTASLLGETTSSSLGVIGSYSAIQTLGYDFARETSYLTTGRQLRLFVVLASSFSY